MGRSAERAGPVRRSAAAAADAVFAIVLAAVLAPATGRFFALKAAVTLGVGDPASPWKGPLPMLVGMVGIFSYGLPFACFLTGLPEAFFGRSLGKAALGLRVAGSAGQPASFAASIVRAALKTAPWWGLCLAFCLESRILGLIASLSLLPLAAGAALALGRRRLSLLDRLCGTAVVGGRKGAAQPIERS